VGVKALTGKTTVNIAVTNGFAYIAAGESGLRIFSVTNPAVPIFLGQSLACGNAHSVLVHSGEEVLQLFPSALRLLGVGNKMSAYVALRLALKPLATLKLINDERMRLPCRQTRGFSP
jgi:hypothetical protein